MSLTSLLQTNAEIREQFRREFKTPRHDRNDAIRAASVTRNYSRVGTAFDYYLRFRTNRLNPHAIDGAWIAEKALLTINPASASFKEGRRIVERARANLAKYLSGNGNDKAVMLSSLELATLDPIFRAGCGEEMIGIVDQGDVTDITALAGLIDDKAFTTSAECILNPSFGAASALVGGADADLLIGDTLLEIKTVKDLAISPHFQQLMGYYCLSCIEGNFNIRNVGIYFARHGILWTIPVNKVVDKATFPALLMWFKQQASNMQSARS